VEHAADPLVPLVLRIKRSDPEALGELHARTATRLLAAARMIVRNRCDAEDVLSDVYRQVWEDAARHDPERATVFSWLLMICRTRAIDRYRSDQRRFAFLQNWTGDCEWQSQDRPDIIVDTVQQNHRLKRALNSLSPLRRRLLDLSFLQDFTHPQIVQITGLPMGTVKSEIRRSLLVLRTFLTDENDPGLPGPHPTVGKRRLGMHAGSRATN
jgi:RNA polymerase sigma-70 factor, ECF subfamily